MSPQRLMMPVVKVCSFTIAVFGLSLMLPLATAWIYSSDNAAAYTLVLLVCESLALAGAIATWNYQIHALTPRHMFLITSVSWLLMSLLGALPLLLTDTVFSLSDAVFESTSGLTTTGSTVLTGLDNLPADILLWRSMLQWIGGLGVIAMAVAIQKMMMSIYSASSEMPSRPAPIPNPDLVRPIISTAAPTYR